MTNRMTRPAALWGLALLAALAAVLAAAGCGNPANKPLEITSVFPADGGVEVPEDAAVEVVFSVPPEKLDEYFTVEPPIEGRFQYLENTAVFLPTGDDENYWHADTQYTVTVKAGVKAKGGRGALGEDLSFSFRVRKSDDDAYGVDQNYETFLPADCPVVGVWQSYSQRENSMAENYEVSVHRLGEGEDYLKQMYKAETVTGRVRVETGDLPEVLAFSQKHSELAESAGKGSGVDIILPEPLTAGWYVATVTPDGKDEAAVQKLLQIQDAAVYTQTNNLQALLWLNSTATGKANAGASVEIIKNPFESMEAAYTYAADGAGVAAFDLPDLGDPLDWDRPESWNYLRGRYRFFYAARGTDGSVYYDCIAPYGMNGNYINQKYYGFLYTDRPIYRQEDTIKFWGVAKPRRDEKPLEKVVAELYHNWGNEPVQTLEAAVSPDGVFTGEMRYEGLASGSLELRVYPADYKKEGDGYQTPICEEYMDIAQYKKPLYTGSLTTDKLYYRPGEDIQAELSVTLFDRTPAAGVQMLLYSSGSDQKALTTDQNGIIAARYPAGAYSNYSGWGWHPVDYHIGAANGEASDVNISMDETVYVFPTTVMLDAKEQRRGEKSDLLITASNIDFSKIPGGRQVIQDYETLRGTPAQVTVQVELKKIAYQKTELQPYYDRYTKTTVPRYSYERSETSVKTFSQRTGADGALLLSDLIPPPEEGVYYYAEIATSDGGRQNTTVSLGDRWYYSPEERTGHLHTFLINSDDTTAQDLYGKGFYYNGPITFRFGEEIGYRVMDNGLPAADGAVMTNLLQGRILRGGEVGGTAGAILCGEETLPNFTLCGAYFDGTRIYPIKPTHMEVEPESRSLNLQILPDKEDYRPGENAEVALRLTDQGGRPVAGASVCLGVVDESVFAVREQDVRMGDDLYSPVFSDYPQVTASYVQHGDNIYYDDGGKGGGGGGDGVTIRENFKDTVDLYSGRTGADGTVSFQVEMPDNLTQWRLTSLALDGKVWWGQARSQLYTTLPFRIDPILSSTFLTGDTIACTVRGFGTQIETTDTVEYTASIAGYEEELTVTAEALAGEMTPLSFQKLPAGEYAMTVTARCGDHADSVKVPFTVRESALLFPIHKTVDLQNGLGDLQPTLYPVEMTIYNEGYRSFMQAWDLLCQDNSGRGDAKIAMASVKGAMTAFFGEGYRYPEVNLAGVQASFAEDGTGKGTEGGIQLFPYAAPDIQTTARTAVAAPDTVNPNLLALFLHHFYDETSDPVDRAAILMGLAALDRLDDGQKTLLQNRAQGTGLPVRESEYLIAGLAYLDQQAAQKLYAKVLAPLFQEQRGTLYVRASTAYDTVDATAGALACAILTGAADDAQKLLGYLAVNSATPFGTMRGPCQLEAALYLNRFQLKDGELPTITYTRGGEKKTHTLPRSGCLRLTLTKDEFENLGIRAEGGPALASVYYTGTPDQLNLTQSPRVTVTKTMDTAENQKHLGGETTVTVKVELGREMPYGQYQLVEWIPSNMRLRGVDTGSYSKIPFSYRNDEQLLTVDFYYSRDSGSVFTFRYTATSVLDTECTLERTYAYNTETMEGGWTEKGEFLPSDYYYLGVGYLFRKE